MLKGTQLISGRNSCLEVSEVALCYVYRLTRALGKYLKLTAECLVVPLDAGL